MVGSSVSLDETSAGENFASGPISATSAASILSFTSAFGADGPGTTVHTITGAGAANLKTAQGDFPITLVQIDQHLDWRKEVNGVTDRQRIDPWNEGNTGIGGQRIRI